MKKISVFSFTFLIFLFLAGGITSASTVSVELDKTISLNGTKFFPLGAYCIGGGLPQKEEQWQEISGWKTNLNSNPFIPELSLPSLQLAEQYQIYAHLSVGDPDHYKNRNWSAIVGNVNRQKNSPYIFAYGLPNEPLVRRLNVEDLEWGYSTIKEADPNHPVIITDNRNFNSLKDSADVFMHSGYPYRTDIARREVLYRFKDWYVKDLASVSPKPLWPLIQTFGSENFYLPTNEEIRAETYLSIILGSTAAIFYAYDCEPFNISNQPAMKDFLKELTEELAEFSPIFLATSSNNRLSYSSGISDAVDASLKEYNGKLYLIAVNKNINNTTAVFRLSGLDIGTSTAVIIGRPGAGSKPGRTIALTGGVFTDNFDGLAVNVYEITTVFPPFGFSISLSATSSSVVRGSSAKTDVIVALISGISKPVGFICSLLPLGASCSFSPAVCGPNCSSTMTINTSDSTPAGTYQIAVIGGTDTMERGASYDLTVAASSSVPAFDFSLSLEPASGSVRQGSSAQTAVTAALISGDSQSVGLNCSGLPAGSSCLFTPSKCGPNCSSILTIFTSAQTPVGVYMVNIVGRGGGKLHNANYQLVVFEPAASLTCPSAPSYPPDRWDRVWCDRTFSRKLSETPDEYDISFDNNWGWGAPGGIKEDDIGFKSGRTIYFPSAGNYEFTVLSDDGIRVWIDDNLVLNKWYDRAAKKDVFTGTLTEGNHKIRLDYYENREVARVSFNYRIK